MISEALKTAIRYCVHMVSCRAPLEERHKLLHVFEKSHGRTTGQKGSPRDVVASGTNPSTSPNGEQPRI